MASPIVTHTRTTLGARLAGGRRNQKMKNDSVFSAVPKNAREAATLGLDLFGDNVVDAEQRFTGENTAVQRGEIAIEDGGIVIPFTAEIRFGKPRSAA